MDLHVWLNELVGGGEPQKRKRKINLMKKVEMSRNVLSEIVTF